MDRSKRLIGFGVGIAIALLAVTFFAADSLITKTDAAGGGPEITMTVSAGGTCDDSGCTVPSGGDFTLSIEAPTVPAEYILFQSFVIYGESFTYTPTAAIIDEFVWPDCNMSVAVRPMTAPNAVGHGCVTGLFPPLPLSTYTGVMAEIALTCAADGTHEIQQIPEGTAPALTNGAQFKDAAGTPIAAKVSNLNVTCGEGGGGPTATPPGPTNTPAPPTDTPTVGPTNTPTNTPSATTPAPTNTYTPVPSSDCGDVNDDGSVTSLDALWILWDTAGLINSTPNTGDINGDGEVDSRDATVLLQFVADLLPSLDDCP